MQVVQNKSPRFHDNYKCTNLMDTYKYVAKCRFLQMCNILGI